MSKVFKQSVLDAFAALPDGEAQLKELMELDQKHQEIVEYYEDRIAYYTEEVLNLRKKAKEGRVLEQEA